MLKVIAVNGTDEGKIIEASAFDCITLFFGPLINDEFFTTEISHRVCKDGVKYALLVGSQ